MTRAKSWFTIDQSSGSVGIAAAQGSQVIANNLQDPTVLRTRAFFSLATANENVPPFYPGNAGSAQIFRVVITDATAPPDVGWPHDAEGVDDVIFHPLIWTPQFYVPTSADMSRPETIYATAIPAGGVADSKGERHIDGNVDILVSWYAGPVLEDVQVSDPLFTVNYWVRCLIEATI